MLRVLGLVGLRSCLEGSAGLRAWLGELGQQQGRPNACIPTLCHCTYRSPCLLCPPRDQGRLSPHLQPAQSCP